MKIIIFRSETAQIVEEAALLELSQPFLEKLKESLYAGYRSDYTLLLGILRKNLNQKRIAKQNIEGSK